MLIFSSGPRNHPVVLGNDDLLAPASTHPRPWDDSPARQHSRDVGASPMQITVGAAQRSLALARHERRGVVADDLEAPVDRRADDEELVEPFGWRGAHQTLGGGENADVGDA